MQVLFDEDEAWSLMTLMMSFVIDNGGCSQEGKQRLRKWRSDRAPGSVQMRQLIEPMNGAIGAFVDQQTNRQVRTKGRYTTKKAKA